MKHISFYAMPLAMTLICGCGDNDDDNVIIDPASAIKFKDNRVAEICIENFDSNGDGQLSYAEAAAVTDIGSIFKRKNIFSFEELQYFTGLERIEASAFYNCIQLTSVIIPKNVTNISIGAFEGCSGLVSIAVDAENTTYDSRDNCNAIIEKASGQLIVGCNNTIVPKSVTSICTSAFSRCTDLQSVSLSCTYISYEAFSGCNGLRSISFGDFVTYIGRFAFEDCSSLTEIKLPATLTIIADYAFYNCRALTDVYCYAEEVPAGQTNGYTYTQAIFGNLPANATLHVPAASVEAYKAVGRWSSAFAQVVAIE